MFNPEQKEHLHAVWHSKCISLVYEVTLTFLTRTDCCFLIHGAMYICFIFLPRTNITFVFIQYKMYALIEI